MLLSFREADAGAYGQLRLRVYKRGQFLYEDVEKNVVLNQGKVLWCKRLWEGTASTGIATMEAGDGGCDESALFTPIAFTATDTALTATINLSATVEPEPVIDVGARTITFKATLVSALADPEEFHYTPRVINELALVTGSPDNLVVALRSFRSIPFDPNEGVEVRAEWTLGLI